MSDKNPNPTNEAPTPWTKEHLGHHLFILANDGDLVCEMVSSCTPARDQKNRERILAMAQYFAGIPTDAIKAMIETCNGNPIAQQALLESKLSVVTQQRDLLIKSLHTLVSNADLLEHDYYALSGHEDFNPQQELSAAVSLIASIDEYTAGGEL